MDIHPLIIGIGCGFFLGILVSIWLIGGKCPRCERRQITNELLENYPPPVDPPNPKQTA